MTSRWFARSLAAVALVGGLAVPAHADPVTAADDSYLAQQDTQLSVDAQSGVLANDADPDGDQLTAAVDTGPSSASSFTLNADGSFTYTPNAGFFGDDSFTYVADDGTVQSDPAKVTIHVNAPPTAANDEYSVVHDGELDVSAQDGLMANDGLDPDGDTTTAVLDSGPSNSSSFTLNADGSFTYTPDAGYFGPDSFAYHLDDGLGGESPSATVAIDVTDAAPSGAPHSYSTGKNQELDVSAPGVLAGLTDPGGGSSTTASVGTPPSHAASFTLNPDGSFSYTPAAGFTGADSFTYLPNDGLRDGSAATVTLAVNELGPKAPDRSLATAAATPKTVTLTTATPTGTPWP